MFSLLDCGHDSKEDAVACMQLMMYKVKEDVKKEHRRFWSNSLACSHATQVAGRDMQLHDI